MIILCTLQRFVTVYLAKYFPREKIGKSLSLRGNSSPRTRVFCRLFLCSESPAGPLPPFSSSLFPGSSVASITKAGHASRPVVECRRNEVFHPPSFPSPPKETKAGNGGGMGTDFSRPSSASCPEVIPLEEGKEGRGTNV